MCRPSNFSNQVVTAKNIIQLTKNYIDMLLYIYDIFKIIPVNISHLLVKTLLNLIFRYIFYDKSICKYIAK